MRFHALCHAELVWANLNADMGESGASPCPQSSKIHLTTYIPLFSIFPPPALQPTRFSPPCIGLEFAWGWGLTT